MKLDEILPKTPYISLMEAITALAFGRVQTADEYIQEENSRQIAYYEGVARLEQAARVAANDAGWPPDWLDNLPNRLTTIYPPEVTALLEAWPNEAARRTHNDGRIGQKARELVEAGEEGRVRFFGRAGDTVPRAAIEPHVLSGRRLLPEESLNSLFPNDRIDDEWSDLILLRAEVAGLDGSTGDPVAHPEPALTTMRRGRPTEINWEALKRECFRLLDYHGQPTPEDSEWNATAKIISSLLDFSSHKLNREISRSSVQNHLKGWLLEWKRAKAISSQ